MSIAVVLVVDGLGAGFLGPYGNTWIETPALNHLAAESLLAERVWATRSSIRDGYQTIWRATGALNDPSNNQPGLISLLNAEGVTTKLLTDAPELTDHPLAAGFCEQLEIDVPEREDLATSWDATHLARFFAEAVAVIESLPANSLLWLHTRGLGAPWDAPLSFRTRYVDEEDPDPTESPAVPHLRLPPHYDDDHLHSIQCACAGQVTLVDQCLGVLLSVIRETAEARETLLAVTSLRGFPLGEHLRVGWNDASVYREMLQVPLLIRFSDGRYAMRRAAGLTELRDLTSILRQWFLGPAKTPSIALPFPTRQFSISRSGDEILLRTAAWHARFRQLCDDAEEDLDQAKLFLNPDDLWEVNDVSGRCPEVVEAAWQFIQICVANPTRLDALAVPEILLTPSE